MVKYVDQGEYYRQEELKKAHLCYLKRIQLRFQDQEVPVECEYEPQHLQREREVAHRYQVALPEAKNDRQVSLSDLFGVKK